MVRYTPEINIGLTSEEVNSRMQSGYNNVITSVKTKKVQDIIVSNTFTLFNILNFSIAFFILLVGSYKNLFFMGVVFCNTLISIIQEIRTKKIMDKLSIVSSTKASVIREGKLVDVSIEEVVLDDIIKFKRGNQIISDSILLEGSLEVNESLISGEENYITKNKGDMLYSGSYVVSGECIARVEHVGEQNYSSKILKGVGYTKKVNSVIINTLKKVIKVISIIIVPFGLILFLKHINVTHDVTESVVSAAAAIIGMIPEGLILLTSTVLAVSIIRLSKKQVLVQELYCIETLARVDTLCLDKTGTLTVGKMEVEKVISLNPKYDYETILSKMSRVLLDDTPTMEAISRRFNKRVDYVCLKKEMFSSEKKYSSVTFDDGRYILGAPEILDKSEKMKDLIDMYSDYRLVLLKKENVNIALILIRDKIRYKAKSTLDYFKNNDVDIKIISGDSEKVISRIAKRLNVEVNSIDMSKVKYYNYSKIAKEYNIFARVNPNQKREIIKALKENNHTVAFIGDGVNDVLALKESDCSIAMSNGADAARNVSEIVLLDSDFDAVPKIVEEGRRTINNVERSASLFLTKTTYAILLAIIFLIIPMSYPFEPVQLSFISTITIGIPAFILALEPNKERIKGNFFINVLKKSIPGGITIVINIISVIILTKFLNITSEEISTLSVILVAMTGFILLYRICYKFNKLRLALYIFLIILFLSCIIGLSKFFELVILDPIFIIYILLLFVLDIGLFDCISKLIDILLTKNEKKFK